jgi:hypothetical protein
MLVVLDLHENTATCLKHLTRHWAWTEHLSHGCINNLLQLRFKVESMHKHMFGIFHGNQPAL